MSVSVDNRSEDIGKILAKVQDDLQYLKAAAAQASEGHIDSDALDMAISRTERGVQAVAERVLASSNNHVVTLPAVSRRPPVAGRGIKPIEELISATNKRSPLKEARLVAGRKGTQTGLSPGQQVQIERVSQLMARPSHHLTRQMLNTHYGLPTARGQSSKEAASVSGQVITGTTLEPLTSLPRANRRNALMTPPAIGESDARRGLLSLLERGLIPPAADIVLSPPPVQPRPVPLHYMAEQHLRNKVAVGGDTNLAGVKLDPNPPLDRGTSSIHLPSVNKSAMSSISNASKVQDVGTVSVKTLVLPISPVMPRPQTPPATPTNRKDSNAYNCKVVIQNGSIVDGVKEFALFKKTFRTKWPHIKTVLNCVEEFCRNYAIPMAMLDGGKISELAFECELGLRPSKQSILESLLNREEVQRTISIPGRRFKGHRGVHAAASKIQATYRMYVKRREYLEYRRMKWAAGVVSLSWLLFAKVYKIRGQLKESRARQLDNHRKRATLLRRRWSSIRKTRRTVVHLPSLGYSSFVRNGLEDFKTSQALQLARLCDIRDPNVEVIYISPISVDQAVLDYYHQLLSMGPAGEGTKDRIHIITPENIDSFGHHHLSLTTHLLYSPQACERLWNLVKGKEAYIVPGVVSRDDVTLADRLGLPILGPDHEITQLYSTRSGYKRIFTDACVTTPPSEGDIFSIEQLVEKLAGLVINHPLVTRWLFKLPDHIRGRGFAYCDVVQHLGCYAWLLKEVERYGEKWTKKWAQEYARKRVLSELPSILSCHAHPLDSTLFPSWDEFLAKFVSEGGLIEGTPPSESVTSLSVDLFIEPTGCVSIMSMRDQILSSPYTVWGSSLPQCSVPPELLTTTALKVGSECKARGVVGYFTIDFVTFIDPKTFEQQLWAVDLDLGYHDHLALQDLVTYVTGAKVESATVQLLVPSQSKGEVEGRCAVVSPHLMHTNLSLIYYPIFFQMCKAHFIGFDPKEREGTVFALVDGQHRERLGMACVQTSLLKALRCCSFNLSTIHQEVSTAHMQGISNFQSASREMDSIAELMDYNESSM